MSNAQTGGSSAATGASPASESTASTGQAGPSGAAAAGFDTKTTVSSLAELKAVAPQVWNAMLQGIAQNICIEMKRQQDHLVEISRQARQDANS